MKDYLTWFHQFVEMLYLHKNSAATARILRNTTEKPTWKTFFNISGKDIKLDFSKLKKKTKTFRIKASKEVCYPGASAGMVAHTFQHS